MGRGSSDNPLMLKFDIRQVLLFFVLIFSGVGVCLVGYGVPEQFVLSSMLLGFGSAAAIYICSERAVIERSLREASKAMQFQLGKGSFASRLESFLAQNERSARVSYLSSFINEDRIHNLGDALYQITAQAYLELPVCAVQLVLSDGSVSNQALAIGSPTNFCSHHEPSTSTREVVKQVGFGNKRFGFLTVELVEGKELSVSDSKILEHLAIQAGVILLDAQVSKQLVKMTEISEESVRAKAGFLANLSHEIRGPLGNILNGVELVEEEYCGPLSADQKKTLALVRRSGSHLLDLVNDVLDYARVESGKLKVDAEVLSVNELLKDVSGLVRAQAIEKGHNLKHEPMTEELFIKCDKRHARQILINLLTNAIKYTKPGGEISVRAEVYDSRAIKIIVADNGIGIAAEEHDKVFGSFERVDDQYALAQTGTGLGMPLTKKLVELNHGYISFESASGKGSTFWLTLPLTEKVEESPEEETEAVDVVQINGESVLLIDHNDETRELVGNFLAKSGFSVINQVSAHGVLDQLSKGGVAVVVLENDLPDLSGAEVLTQIRNDSRYQQLPVVVLSSRAFQFDVERFLRLGADRCFAKPVNLKELTSAVSKLCQTS